MRIVIRSLASGAVTLGLLIGNACAPTPETEKNKIIVKRAWEQVINQRNLDEADELFGDDYIFHLNNDRYLKGLDEGVKQPVSKMLTAFPDFHCTIEDMIAEGDLVVHRWSATGTHQGEYGGIPATGRQVTMTGIILSRLADGKHVEDWSCEDDLGTFQQLGAIPPMGREDFSWGKPMEPVTGTPGSPEDNKAIYRREADELWIKGNLDVADEIFAANFVNHDPLWPDVTNLESFKHWVAGWIEDAPDMQLDIEAIVAEGDKVAGRWVCRWTDTAGMAGSPPTGKQITVTGMDICRIEDGKIVERWWAKDGLGAMKQLGVIPPPEETEE